MKWLKQQLERSESLYDGRLIAIGIGIGIVLALIYDAYFNPIVEVAHAEEVVVEEVPEEVQIEVVYSKEDIIRKIRETFPEDPDTAVAIAKCESGLKIEIQSHHVLSYGQERSFGLFQVHAPDWDKKAMQLGYVDYKDTLEDNLKMARYIYESAGKTWRPWTCRKMI